jgi:hypothetical protein
MMLAAWVGVAGDGSGVDDEEAWRRQLPVTPSGGLRR